MHWTELLDLQTEVNKTPLCIALGFFDGLHIGHRAVLGKTVELAKDKHLAPAVFTFQDTQDMKPQQARLFSSEERFSFFESCGIEEVYVVPLKLVQELDPKEFVEHILVQLLSCEIALCGTQFRFGKDAKGTSEDLSRFLQSLGKQAFVIEEQRYKGDLVSSTRIRHELEMGNLDDVKAMLGFPYYIKGVVEHGKQLGRTIDFPTINCSFKEHHVIPLYGVYVTRIDIQNETYYGVTNIGTRPTVSGDHVTCETHLLGYEGKELYGIPFQLTLLHFLRKEQKFSSLQNLKIQIQKDIEEALKYVAR